MNQVLQLVESGFTIFALVFFTGVLNFDSFTQPSEGKTEVISLLANPFAPALSLVQHSIFLGTIFLLFFRNKDVIRTIAQGKVIWILVFLVPLSIFWSTSPDFTLRRSFAFLETCAFGLYLASRYNFKEQLRLIACAIAIATIISLFYTFAFPVYGIEDGIHQGAWRGPFIQKNIFARLLTLGCLSYTQIKSDLYIHNFLIFGGFILSFGLIILTSSTTALVVLVLLFLINLICKSLYLKDILAIPLVLTLFLIASTTVAIVSHNLVKILTFLGKDSTLSGRIPLWTWLIEQVKLRPLLGYGYMGFWNDPEAKSILAKYSNSSYVPPHSHNGYLDTVISFGLIGMVLFIITYVMLFRRAYILMRWDRTHERLWPILFLSFLLLYNFTEPTFIEHNSIFWIIYLSLAISRFIQLEPKSFNEILSPLPQSSFALEEEN